MMFGKNAGSAETAKRIPKGSTGIEVGVWRGDTTKKFLQRARFLHLVDPWSVVAYEDSDEFGDYGGYLDRYSKLVGSRNPKDFQGYYDLVHYEVSERFKSYPVKIHRMTSAEFFASHAKPVDWVYLDGSHAYQNVYDDLASATLIANQVFGDDYGTKPGVTAAVDDFVLDNGLRLEVFAGDQYQIWN